MRGVDRAKGVGIAPTFHFPPPLPPPRIPGCGSRVAGFALVPLSWWWIWGAGCGVVAGFTVVAGVRLCLWLNEM